MSGGITDEAAMEGHDLIQRAEEEEERMHEHDHDQDMSPKTGGQAKGTLGGAPPSGEAPRARKDSKLDKMKEALHMKK